MPAKVSVKSKSGNEEAFYTSFKAAISNAHKGDLITIYKDTKEQLIIDRSVDIVTAANVVFRRKKDSLPLFVAAENVESDEILSCSISGFTIEDED